MPATARRRRSRNESLDLVRYLALFDLDLGEIPPEQVAMFIAARGAAEYVEDMAIPIASRPQADEEVSLHEIETEDPIALTGYHDDPVGDDIPSNDMDVAMIQSSEQLPRIFPTQWLLEDICPEAFYTKVAQRELLMPEWQRPTGRPEDSYDDSPFRELVEDQGVPDTPKQHAYLLLDTSRTMSDHDRRGTVARGLALAFLLKGHQQRSQLNFRPFTDDVAELVSGSSRDDFCDLARRVAAIPNGGQTRIQTALEQAVNDVRREGPCLRADIMLITDGISRLTQNPLDAENLHTFLVSDLMAEDESTGVIRTLRDWSRTFRRVWKSRFQEILTPTLADLQAANRQLQALTEKAADGTDDEIARLHQMLENVKCLAAEMRKAAGKKAPVPEGVQDIENQLATVEKRLPPRAKRTGESSDQSTSSTRGATQGTLASGTAGAPVGKRGGLWQLLRRVAGGLWRWTLGGIIARLRRKS